ncbi:universal stress protein [Marinigracilibium pacificum]|uniref:Universal stress protein n=1 Tax=Marinigracilibium pacificum TaxID=2729599 RepID=A0A848J0I8_9BACT|nr:universal stress protein [Marinigracilibium pacificum]NMM47994.1 universal stress protein [Marinigracilibium pacificum]
MYKIKKVLVGLDLSKLDDTLIDYSNYFAKLNDATDLKFIKITPEIAIPAEIKKEFPDMVKRAITDKKNQMKEVIVNKIGVKPPYKVSYEVVKGQKAKRLLKYSHSSDIDLIIVGRKRKKEGSGVLVNRLARRADCSLLIIPEGSKAQINKLHVPIDFSKNAKDALEEGIQIASMIKNHEGRDVEIICQNVYNVPVGYHYSGRSYEEFSQIMRENAKKNFATFIKKIDTKGTNIRAIYSLDTNENPIEDIYNLAKGIQADLVLFGAKGRTALPSLFIGSMAERLIQFLKDIPVMVVRRKGTNAGILESLREF